MVTMFTATAEGSMSMTSFKEKSVIPWTLCISKKLGKLEFNRRQICSMATSELAKVSNPTDEDPVGVEDMSTAMNVMTQPTMKGNDIQQAIHEETVEPEDVTTKISMKDDEIQHAIQETDSNRPDENKEEPEDMDMDSAPPSPSAVSTEPGGYETTLELPRDVLTAYILIRLNGTWDKLSTWSKGCIAFGFCFSWFAQFTVFASLITDTVLSFWGEFEVSFSGEDFLFNLVAISALFMYLWKDLMAYYNSVCFTMSPFLHFWTI